MEPKEEKGTQQENAGFDKKLARAWSARLAIFELPLYFFAPPIKCCSHNGNGVHGRIRPAKLTTRKHRVHQVKELRRAGRPKQ